MKTLQYKTYLFLILAAVFFSFTQKDEIVAGLKTGNAEKIGNYFDQTVELNFPGKGGSYSKTQAVLVLKDFFSLNRSKGFEVKHSGNNAASNFIIGTLLTSNGSYRTTVFMRQKGDKLLIQGIEFEASN
jgi:hypothetical protein